jgi:hypothetical protein
MIGFDRVVRVLLGHLPRRTDGILDHKRVDRLLVGGDLNRRRTMPQRTAEERLCRGGVAPVREHHVDDLAVLLDRAIQVVPAAGDLDTRFVDEPPTTWYVPGGSGGAADRGDRRADGTDGQLSGQDLARALSVLATGRARPPDEPGGRAAMGRRYLAAQNAQWCLVVKSVSICGWGGTSDSICVLFVPSKAGQGTAADVGLPVAAKFAQAARCWSRVPAGLD